MRMYEFFNLMEKWSTIPEEIRNCVSPSATPKRSDPRDLDPQEAEAAWSFLRELALATDDQELFEDVTQLLRWIDREIRGPAYPYSHEKPAVFPRVQYPEVSVRAPDRDESSEAVIDRCEKALEDAGLEIERSSFSIDARGALWMALLTTCMRWFTIDRGSEESVIDPHEPADPLARVGKLLERDPDEILDRLPAALDLVDPPRRGDEDLVYRWDDLGQTAQRYLNEAWYSSLVSAVRQWSTIVVQIYERAAASSGRFAGRALESRAAAIRYFGAVPGDDLLDVEQALKWLDDFAPLSAINECVARCEEARRSASESDWWKSSLRDLRRVGGFRMSFGPIERLLEEGIAPRSEVTQPWSEAYRRAKEFLSKV